MIQHEFEELLEQFSQDELNEKSTVKGQFTSYITRRMEWHAIRYAAKNRPNVIVISLDQAPRHLTDIDAEQMFRKVEIELALQQEVQRLSPKEKEWLLCFLKMNYKEIQKHFGCGHLGTKSISRVMHCSMQCARNVQLPFDFGGKNHAGKNKSEERGWGRQ